MRKRHVEGTGYHWERRTDEEETEEDGGGNKGNPPTLFAHKEKRNSPMYMTRDAPSSPTPGGATGPSVRRLLTARGWAARAAAGATGAFLATAVDEPFFEGAAGSSPYTTRPPAGAVGAGSAMAPAGRLRGAGASPDTFLLELMMLKNGV